MVSKAKAFHLSQNSVDPQATCKIPDELDSIETLRFLEFRPETAKIVYRQFLKREKRFPGRANIFKSARNYVLSVAGNAAADSDDWIGLFDRIGLTEGYKARIMDPNWKHMRLTASLKHWTLEMIDMRAAFLSDNERSQNEESSIRTLPRTPPGEAALVAPQGCTWFFRGGDIARLKQFFYRDGTPRMHGLLFGINWFSDFFIGQALYITKDLWVATEYMEWARRVTGGNILPVGILRIAIPNDLLASTVKLKGDLWRQTVWQRHRHSIESRNPILEQHLKNFVWMKGPQCSQSSEVIVGLKDKSELNVLKIRGKTVVHYCTDNQDMFEQLDERCAGNAYIEEGGGPEARN